jgi:large subunit ribosomal protein L25
METVELGCEQRQTRTNGEVRALRRAGRIPAIIYGPKMAAQTIALASAELSARVGTAGTQRLIRLKSESPELNGRHVILKEVQREAISGALIHADLMEVDLTRRLRVSVPLRFSGRAAGIAEGGILQPLVRQVEVECLPLEIPEFIEVDVTALGIHDVIHISAVSFGANIKPLYDSDYAVVSVLPPSIEEAPVAAAPAEGAEAEAAAAGAAPEAGAAAPAAGAAPAEAGAKEPAGAPGKKPEATAGKKSEAAKK